VRVYVRECVCVCVIVCMCVCAYDCSKVTYTILFIITSLSGIFSKFIKHSSFPVHINFEKTQFLFTIL
jgi:hypothetical protein